VSSQPNKIPSHNILLWFETNNITTLELMTLATAGDPRCIRGSPILYLVWKIILGLWLELLLWTWRDEGPAWQASLHFLLHDIINMYVCIYIYIYIWQCPPGLHPPDWWNLVCLYNLIHGHVATSHFDLVDCLRLGLSLRPSRLWIAQLQPYWHCLFQTKEPTGPSSHADPQPWNPKWE
jgi:hypothetical protein